MTSSFKVLALKADDGGCGYYRVTLPAKYAAACGVDIEVLEDLPVDMTVRRDGTSKVHSVNTDADVIIFQRPLLHAFYPAIIQAQKQGIACIVELDDDLGAVHPENLAYNEVDPKQNPLSNWVHLKNAMEIADWCIVSTPALARKYAPHGRFSIIRNVLPQSVWEIPKTFETPARLGWTGSVVTHPKDLEVTGAHIGTVLRTTHTQFSVIGDGSEVRERLFIPEEVNVQVHGWSPLETYQEDIAKFIDVGIVPLEDSAFNASKSYLKGLEFAAVGIPFVASPTDEYMRLSKMGVGKIARKGIEWQKHLKRMITDRDVLLEESAHIREATKHLTYENHIEQWLNAWADAIVYRSKISK